MKTQTAPVQPVANGLDRLKSATRQPLVIGVGEVLWDLLPAGKQPGGAPANFAYHAQALGAQALVVSRVGDDGLGRELIDRFRALGLRTDGLGTHPALPTGTVGVTLDPGGTPAFTIHNNVAWDYIEVGEDILDEAARAAAICFGTLAQRNAASRSAIRAVLTAVARPALRVFDVNLRQHFWSPELIEESLNRSNVLKLNDEELPVLARIFSLTGDPLSQVRQLAKRFGLNAVALTRGAGGSLLLVGDQAVSHPGSPITIADTVGAGDSYTAALALGLLAGHNPGLILESAHQVADFVCTQPGGMPPMPPHMLRERRLQSP